MITKLACRIPILQALFHSSMTYPECCKGFEVFFNLAWLKSSGEIFGLSLSGIRGGNFWGNSDVGGRLQNNALRVYVYRLRFLLNVVREAHRRFIVMMVARISVGDKADAVGDQGRRSHLEPSEHPFS